MPCRTSGGWQLVGGYHAARRDALAGMSDDEKIAAYAQEQARREASQAEFAARNADPVCRAELEKTRAQTGAACDAMRAHAAAEEREKRQRCANPFYHPQDCRCREPGWVPPTRPLPVPYGVLPVADLTVERATRRRQTERPRGAGRSNPS